jgi:hypothetical protein
MIISGNQGGSYSSQVLEGRLLTHWTMEDHQRQLVPMEGASHFGHFLAGKHHLIQEDFWLKFSDLDGNRLLYTAIVKWLTDLRLAEDEKMAAIVKEKYGDTFASIFTYKKGGKTYVKRKSAHIAKQYHELTGMPDNNDDE